MKMLSWNKNKLLTFSLVTIVLFLSACKEKEESNHIILSEIDLPAKLKCMLNEDLNTYRDYRGVDTVFVLIEYTRDSICELRFYATENISPKFHYNGFFYIDNILFLWRKPRVKDEDLAQYLDVRKDKPKKFPTVLDNRNSSYDDIIYDPYTIYYQLKRDSLYRPKMPKMIKAG